MKQKFYWRPLRAVMLLLFVLTAATAWAAVGDVVSSGTSGKYNNLTWTATENGDDPVVFETDKIYTYPALTLTIRGTGEITSYDHKWPFSSVTRLVIESGITNVTGFDFYKALTHVTLPNTLTTIDWGAFYGCYKLTDINIPSSVKTIRELAFEGCYSLTSITLPEGLDYIGADAFRATSLTDVNIPNSVTNIGDHAFFSTPFYEAQPEGLVCVGDWLIRFEGSEKPLTWPLPTSVKKIASEALGDLVGKNYVSITIPAGVTAISNSAFVGCLADNVYCYADPAALTWDTDGIPETHDHGRFDDFKPSKATKFHVADADAWNTKFPNANVTFVGDLSPALFAGNCGSEGHEEDVTWSYDLYTRTLSINGTGAMADYVPYETNAPWFNLLRKEIEKVSFGSGVTYIGKNAFYECTNLSTVDFSGVETIGDHAFQYCTSLTAFDFSGVTTIGTQAFRECTGLTSLNLNGVVTIGVGAFLNCTGLTSITIPNSVTTLSGFSGCTGLTSITIPNSVTTLDNGAFNECTGLTGSLVIPSSVNTINLNAFRNCSGLTTVTIPASVTSIGSGVFTGCTGVTDVYCYANPSNLTWNNNTTLFKGNSKETRCHVPADYLTAWNSFSNEKVKGSLTFVGDLDTYIFNADNWDYLATSVANGGTTSGKTYKLFDNITVSTMIGTSTNPFAGTFDGQGNTLTLDINTSEGAAPIRNISGATIKNLKVDGTLSAGNHSAALVGVVRGGTNVIENCVVSADITLSRSSYGGGIVAHGTSATTTLKGCVFDGTIKGGTEVGTLWGWSDAAKVTITDCLDLSATTHPIGRSLTDDGYSISVNNTYYTNPEKSTEGEYPWIDEESGIHARAYTDKLDDIGAEGTDYGFVTAYASGLGYNGKYYMFPTIILADNVDNSTVIKDNNFEVANVTLSGRTLYKDGAWNTLCLPFNLTAREIAESPLAGADIRTLSSASFDEENRVLTLNFTPAVGNDPDNPAWGSITSIEPGVPYIIRWEKANDYVDDDEHNIVNPTFQKVTLCNDMYPVVVDDVITFQGGYAPISFTEADKSILFLGAENTLYDPMPGARINACRAYFQLSSGAAVKEFKLNFGEEDPTSLSEELRVKSEESANAVYDLSGRRINSQFSIFNSQLPKGIYIYNGKKILK